MTTLKDAQGAKAAAMAAERHPEIPALTGLRFLAALSVAVAHGASVSFAFKGDEAHSVANTIKLWISNGAGFGMALFFVLSGFVIHYNYHGVIRSNGIRGFAQFMWARFSRLYPLFLVVLITDMMFSNRLFDTVAREAQADIMPTVAALPYYLTFTQSWLYTTIGNSSLIYQIGNAAPVMWSISTEWFFYLCYPIILVALVRASRPAYAIGLAIAWTLGWGSFAYILTGYSIPIESWAVAEFGTVAAIATFNGGSNQDSFVRWIMYFSPYMRIGEFILGCLVAQAHMALRNTKIAPWEKICAPYVLAAAIVSLPVILYMMFEIGGTSWIRRLSYNFGLTPSIAVLLFCAARYRPRALRPLETPAMQRLGDASYSIYLIHLIIFVAFIKGMQTPLPDGMDGIVFLFLRLLIMLAVVLLLSLALFTYVEDPSRRALRRLWTQPRGLLRPGTVALAPALCAAGLVGSVYVVQFLQERRIEATSGIVVTSATYGESCGVRPGNATGKTGAACNGQTDCTYVVDVALLGDPAGGCAKDFSVDYICAPGKTPRRIALPAEAGLKSQARLQCHAGIMVTRATYGGSCGARSGNATAHLRAACDARSDCGYVVDVSDLGDPAPGCGKDFTVEFTCGADGLPQLITLPAESGLKSLAQLQCTESQVAR